MRIILILLVGLGGLWLTVTHLRKNIAEIRTRSKEGASSSDKWINYPLMALWFGYLLVFFTGLMVNNLIFR